MSKKRSYIGGHRILTQRPGDFEAELERKAVNAKRRSEREQAAFDKARKKKLTKTRARIDAFNRADEKAAADRRATSWTQTADKIRRAPKTDVVVLSISAKVTRSSTPKRKQTGDD
jgi:hypothetical protein